MTPRFRFDVDALYVALDRLRRRRRMSWRDVARATEVSPSTFTRIAHGDMPSVASLVALLEWLEQGMSLTPYITREKP